MTMDTENKLAISISTIAELQTHKLHTTLIRLHGYTYSVIEYEAHITIKRADLHVDIGYLFPCIRSMDIDVCVCDSDGQVCGFGVIEHTDEHLPIHDVHKQSIQYVIDLQAVLNTTPTKH